MSSMNTFVKLFVVMSLRGPAFRACGRSGRCGNEDANRLLPADANCLSVDIDCLGAASVGPRDTCNGLEDATNKQYQYWDGKI